MLSLEEIESGLLVTHRNTGLRYSVVDLDEGEVLLSPEQNGLKDLTVPIQLFRDEFVSSERFRGPSGARRRSRPVFAGCLSMPVIVLKPRARSR